MIDLDIPITGSLDDPQFKVAPIIWQAVVNVVTKIATAPFRFIANLVGGGEDMDSIAFESGQSQFVDSELSKLQKLTQALQSKPELAVEIRANFDQQRDLLALQQEKFKQVLATQAKSALDDLRILERMFVEKFGIEAFKQQQVLHLQTSQQPDNNLQLSRKSYELALKNALIAEQKVTEGELRQLALERAKIIRNQLVEQGQIDPSRLFILEPTAVSMPEQTYIASQMMIKVD